MLEPKYPYRFKTEEEFIQEYGDNWRRTNPVFFSPDMDYLLGIDFVKKITIGFKKGQRHINVPRQSDSIEDYWEIHIAHLIENKLKIPTYMLSKNERKGRFVY